MSDTTHPADSTTPEITQQRAVAARNQRKGRKKVAVLDGQLERLKIEYVPIGDVKPNAWNPNRQDEHAFELLLRSIQEDGFTQPVICLMDGTIVDGEHRWRAAQVLEYEEIPIVRHPHMDAARARIATVRHNKARGSHDVELDAQLLKDLQALGALEQAQDALMIDDVELNLLLHEVDAPEALAGEDFGDAWIPDKFTDEEREQINQGKLGEDAKTHTDESGEVIIAASTEAIDLSRRREELIDKAKTLQDKDAASRDAQQVRFNLIFDPDEGKIVKQVLGKKPAAKLLEICRHILEDE